MKETNKDSVFINESTVIDGHNQVKNQNTQHKSFFKEEKQDCSEAMKRKFSQFVDRAANFLQCTRLFSTERLQEIRKSSEQEIQQRSYNHTTKSMNSDHFNNNSKFSTNQDQKSQLKSSKANDLQNEKELPIKNYHMKSVMKFQKKYAETYDQSYSERQIRFKYTFQQVCVRREVQYQKKVKTFWGELKRLLFCRGGNYIEDIQESERTDAQSRRKIGSASLTRQPHLIQNYKQSQNNIFMQQSYEKIQAPPQQIKFQKRPKKNIQKVKYVSENGQKVQKQNSGQKNEDLQFRKAPPAHRRQVEQKKQQQFIHIDHAPYMVKKSQNETKQDMDVYEIEEYPQHSQSHRLESNNRNGYSNNKFDDSLHFEQTKNRDNRNSNNINQDNNNQNQYNNNTNYNNNHDDHNNINGQNNSDNFNNNYDNNYGKNQDSKFNNNNNMGNNYRISNDHRQNNVDDIGDNRSNVNGQDDRRDGNYGNSTANYQNSNGNGLDISKNGANNYNSNYDTANNTINNNNKNTPNNNNNRRDQYPQNNIKTSTNKNRQNYNNNTLTNQDIISNTPSYQEQTGLINNQYGNHHDNDYENDGHDERDMSRIRNNQSKKKKVKDFSFNVRDHNKPDTIDIQQDIEEIKRMSSLQNKHSRTENVSQEKPHPNDQQWGVSEDIDQIKYEDHTQMQDSAIHNQSAHTVSAKKNKKIRKVFTTKEQDDVQPETLAIDTPISKSNKKMLYDSNNQSQLQDSSMFSSQHEEHAQLAKRKKNKKRANLVVVGQNIDEEINVDDL